MLKEIKSFFELRNLLWLPFLLVQVQQSLDHSDVGFFLFVTYQQMLFYLTPIANGSINVYHSESSFDVLRNFAEHLFKIVEGFIGIANNEEDVSQIIEATYVFGILY